MITAGGEKQMSKKAFILVSICLLTTVIGCTNQGGTTHTNNYTAKTVKESKANNQHLNTKSTTKSSHQALMKEDELVKELEKMNGVNKATVYRDGQNVLVGLDVKDEKKAENIRNNVQTYMLKKHPNHQIHVTTDKNLHSRIQKLKPLDGHPIRNTAEDVNILINDIGNVVTAPFR